MRLDSVLLETLAAQGWEMADQRKRRRRRRWELVVTLRPKRSDAL